MGKIVLSNPIFITTKTDEASQPYLFKKKGRISGWVGNSSHPKKRCHADGGGFSISSFKFNIFGREKRLTMQNIRYVYFRLEVLTL